MIHEQRQYVFIIQPCVDSVLCIEMLGQNTSKGAFSNVIIFIPAEVVVAQSIKCVIKSMMCRMYGVKIEIRILLSIPFCLEVPFLPGGTTIPMLSHRLAGSKIQGFRPILKKRSTF